MPARCCCRRWCRFIRRMTRKHCTNASSWWSTGCFPRQSITCFQRFQQEVCMLETMLETPTITLPFSYGFDDVALVPHLETLDPELCDLSFSIGKHTFDLPIMAAAMDGVVDPAFAAQVHRQGG